MANSPRLDRAVRNGNWSDEFVALEEEVATLRERVEAAKAELEVIGPYLRYIVQTGQAAMLKGGDPESFTRLALNAAEQAHIEKDRRLGAENAALRERLRKAMILLKEVRSYVHLPDPRTSATLRARLRQLRFNDIGALLAAEPREEREGD